MRNLILLLMTLFVLVSAHGARAQLVWDQKVINLHATGDEARVAAHFRYKNAGDYPVKILAVVTSCGCTTAKYPADPIPPKGTGEIVGTFDIGGRRGLQPRTITVETDDQKNGTKTVLEMITQISEVLQLKPTFVEWDRNEATTPKKINVQVLDNFPVKGLKATSQNPAMTATVETVAPGKEYNVVVTPGNTSAGLKTLVTIEPDIISTHPKQFFAHLRIK